MKVTVNVECSPEEARSFLGLPDVAPMQQALMSELEERLRSCMQTMIPSDVTKAWVPGSMPNIEEAQRLFWSQFQKAMNGFATTTTNAMLSFANRERS